MRRLLAWFKGDPLTLIAVAITVESDQGIETALECARAEAKRGADIVEWRVDALVQSESALACVASLIQQCPLPSIVTPRGSAEGGSHDGPEKDRLEFLLAVCGLPVPPSYVDLELASFQGSQAFQKQFAKLKSSTRLILSAHDFQTRPGDLSKRVCEMWSEPRCSVAKIAWRARSVRDNLEAFELMRHQGKPTIALCMGNFGIPSRVMAPKFGGFLTYARPKDELATAPGQPTVDELLGAFSFKQINAASRFFGVVGWPIEHSLSPLLHNSAFASTRFNGVFVPLSVAPEWESFKASLGEMAALDMLDLCGVSVTLPHKEHALRWCKERGGRADVVSQWCQAANTLLFSAADGVSAFNTDAPAAVAALAHAMGMDPISSSSLASGAAGLADNIQWRGAFDQWSHHRVLLLGAGGAARAVASGLALAGAHVTISNRTHSKAAQLAAQLDGRDLLGERRSRVVAVALDQLAGESFSVIVNCTSAGMLGSGFEACDPLPAIVELKSGMVVMDSVYRPRETPLLKRARSAGAVLVDGTEMFLRQAALQFELFTEGQTPPTTQWRELLNQKLCSIA